jgi:hypothetical protein
VPIKKKKETHKMKKLILSLIAFTSLAAAQNFTSLTITHNPGYTQVVTQAFVPGNWLNMTCTYTQYNQTPSQITYSCQNVAYSNYIPENISLVTMPKTGYMTEVQYAPGYLGYAWFQMYPDTSHPGAVCIAVYASNSNTSQQCGLF